MPSNFHRPNLPYQAESLANYERFQILTRALNAPPSPIMLDSEFNSVTDALNVIYNELIGVVAGNIPGSDNPDNANMVVTLDGNGNLPLKLISDENCEVGSINANKLIPSSVTVTQLQDACITNGKLANDSVTTNKLADQSVTNSKLGFSSVGFLNIADNAVGQEELQNSSVITAKLANLSVSTAKLIDLSVTAAKLADLSISTGKLIDLSVTTPKLADISVTTAKLADLAVTAAKIANNTITFSQISNSFAATKAQQQAAVSSSVFVSPSVQQHHPSAVSFWCSFDGTLTGTNPPLSSYNVSSVTRNSAGNYTINYTNNFSSSNYCIIPASGPSALTPIIISRSSSSCTVETRQPNQSATDQTFVCVAGLGTLA